MTDIGNERIQPRAAVTVAIAAAGTGALKEHQSSMGTQPESTAKQISAYMSEYLAMQGWIPAEDMKKAKIASAN
jgi:hypothetical protein